MDDLIVRSPSPSTTSIQAEHDLGMSIWLTAVSALLALLMVAKSSNSLLLNVRSALSRVLFHQHQQQHQRQSLDSQQNRLAFLDVFRVCATCWVISNHLGSEGRLDVLRRESSGQQFKQTVQQHPVFGPLLGNSGLSVEIFLVLSGFLAALSWYKNRRPEHGFWHNVIWFLLRRWLRLAPTTLAFLLLANSPVAQWALPQFHVSMASACTTRRLFSYALFLNNWVSMPTCMGWLWYLGLDWQCHVFAPFLLQLLAKKRRIGVALCCAIIFTSILVRAWHCRAHGICHRSDVDIPFVHFPVLSIESLQSLYTGLFTLYARPATKCGPFIVGLLIGFGYMERVNNNNNARRFTLHCSTTTGGIFAVGAGLALTVIYGILPVWNGEQTITGYNTFYTAIFHTVFAIAVGLMIVALLARAEPLAISPIWTILTRLAFSTFLVHMPVVFLFNHVDLFQRTMSVYGLLLALPCAIFASFAVALVFHCAVEYPLSQLSNLKEVGRR